MIYSSIIALPNEQHSTIKSSEASCNQVTTQNLIHLFRNTVRVGHEETLSWICYSDNFENKVAEICHDTGVTDKTARTQILEHLTGVMLVVLWIKTLTKKLKNSQIIWREWCRN